MCNVYISDKKPSYLIETFKQTAVAKLQIKGVELGVANQEFDNAIVALGAHVANCAGGRLFQHWFEGNSSGHKKCIEVGFSVHKSKQAGIEVSDLYSPTKITRQITCDLWVTIDGVQVK